MFYLTTHSTHFIYSYMVKDHSDSERGNLLRRHMGYSVRLTARVLLYAPSHRQDNIYHSLCYTSRGALAGTRNSSMGPLHEGSIRRPIVPWANTLTTELHLAPSVMEHLLVVQWVVRSNPVDGPIEHHNWCWCCLYIFSCLYPLKVQACYPGPIPQLCGLSV